MFLSCSCSGAQSATAKFIETICFAIFAIFQVYLIKIYLKSTKILIRNTKGFESIGINIPLYAFLVVIFFS